MQKKATYYPNMDIVRYILAFAVLIIHYGLLASHSIPVFAASYDLVGGFFCISGFLMYPSLNKSNNLKQYIVRRAKKILPSYIFIVIFLVGSGIFLTSLSPLEYLSNPQTWQYLTANITFLNWLQPELPGVFDGVEYLSHAVNGSLWTMKVEWALYLSLPLFVWISKKAKCNFLFISVFLILFAIIYRILFLYLYNHFNTPIFEILGRQFFGQFSYFYSGMVIYILRDKFIPLIKYLLPGGLLLYYFIPTTSYTAIIIQPLLTAIIVLSFSLISKSQSFLRHNDNISYNIYLFHFPVIQASIHFGINNYPVYISFSCVLIVTLILSFLSARFIDRPFNKKPRS